MSPANAPFPPKPIKIWLTPPGPNPWMVVVICEKLGLNYEFEVFEFKDIKSMPFIGINPNGRVPAIEDPNTGVTLWESGAIIQYLVEQYDIQKKLMYDTLVERHQLNQWLQFQMSGQGPYFGQLAWFKVLHHEKLPSAIERYHAEMKRILGVLDKCLAGREWLVGDNTMFDGFPNFKSWHKRMTLRESWSRSMAIRSSLMAQQGLENGTGRLARFKTHKEYEDAIKRGEDVTA
ncbi:glutathione S-transferase [Xylariaceae sp. FL0255]|nr:glutathione S-transferase [Xylariaceae sp. FL0255]